MKSASSSSSSSSTKSSSKKRSKAVGAGEAGSVVGDLTGSNPVQPEMQGTPAAGAEAAGTSSAAGGAGAADKGTSTAVQGAGARLRQVTMEEAEDE